MSDPVTVERAILDRLIATSGLPPIVFENGEGNAAIPRLVVRKLPDATDTATLDGQTNCLGEFVITIVVAKRTGKTDMWPIYQALLAAFPAGLDVGGGTISRVPTLGAYLAEDDAARQTVGTRYQTSF